jgi:type IV pilus assembly protein PilB
MSVDIGKLVVEEELVGTDALRRAAEHAEQNGCRLEESLLELGLVEEEAFTKLLARAYGVELIDLAAVRIDVRLTGLVPAPIAWRCEVLPVARDGSSLTLAMADPSDLRAIDEVQFLTGYSVRPVLASTRALARAIQRAYRPNRALALDTAPGDIELSGGEEIDLVALEKGTSDVTVINLCNLIVTEAVRRGVDEVYIEPAEREYRVRFRINGVVYTVMNPPLNFRDPMNNRFKVMAHLDIAERHRPQRGCIGLRLMNERPVRRVDVEVNSIPTPFGEKLVLRVYERERFSPPLTELGLSRADLDRLRHALGAERGIILVTGTRRSGLTTSLASALLSLDLVGRSALTACSELHLDGKSVSQLRWYETLDVEESIRSALSQRPDVLLFDPGSERVVFQLIRQGAHERLVLASLTARDTISALFRLLRHGERGRLGIDRATLLSSIRLVTSQRLLRKPCGGCAVEQALPVERLRELGWDVPESGTTTGGGKGCARCNWTGSDRFLAVFEVLELDDGIRERILAGAGVRESRELAISRGLVTLAEAANRLLVERKIPFSEIENRRWL